MAQYWTFSHIPYGSVPSTTYTDVRLEQDDHMQAHTAGAPYQLIFITVTHPFRSFLRSLWGGYSKNVCTSAFLSRLIIWLVDLDIFGRFLSPVSKRRKHLSRSCSPCFDCFWLFSCQNRCCTTLSQTCDQSDSGSGICRVKISCIGLHQFISNQRSSFIDRHKSLFLLNQAKSVTEFTFLVNAQTAWINSENCTECEMKQTQTWWPFRIANLSFMLNFTDS